MNINRAVEILINDKVNLLRCSVVELREAKQLAIEGLLRIQRNRNTPFEPMDDPLPGETKE